MTRTLVAPLALAAPLVFVACGSATAVPSRTPEVCRGTRDGRPHEVVRPAPDDVVVSHELTFEVPGARERFVRAFLDEKLSTFIRGQGKLPGVDHTEALTASLYPAPGSVRLICLADGNTADEEVLEQDARHLRYLVTNYSSPEAAPILYGIGEFTFEPAAGSPEVTRVRWRYSFKLRSNRFPGYLGGLGRSLFRSHFLESDYAPFMEQQVREIRVFAGQVGQGSAIPAQGVEPPRP